jgi:PAS domain S-box-containing protein
VAAVAVAVEVASLPAPAPFNWVALPLLVGLLVAATWFVVPFRYGDSVDAVNLIEAALAPLLVAYPPLVVVAVAALSQVVNGLLRRLSWVKTAFNTAMWALAAGLGSAVVAAVGGRAIWPQRILGLLAALAVVGLVNNVAFATVLALAERDRLRRIAVRFAPVVQLAWLGGWGVNAAVGLLFALAYLASPVAVALFGVPLLVLHLAYRSYSAARADQARLAAAHAAAARLAEPLEPLAAVPAFLREVAACFDAAAAELVLRVDGGRDVHRVDRASGRYTLRSEAEDIASFEGAVAATPGAVLVSASLDDPLGRALADAGASECLAAPLLDVDRLVGAILVFDREGFEGSRAGEHAVLEALARETTGALAKGRLLADVLDERRKLAEIVDRASDGIATFADDGSVLTWNPALERITGLRSDDVLGRAGAVARLRLRSVEDEPIDVTHRPLAALPNELRLTATDGTTRHLTCSYSTGGADADSAALVVVARDVTPVEEHEALREQVTRLVEADAARRAVVEQLQQAVVPAPVAVPGGEIAAAYEASDESAPTGGDLYDWQVLPSGEVHVAVVDVLGHGVAATKDALAVVHTLRVVTAAGTPLERVVARADELLRAQHPDLVATVIVARYTPDTGRLQVAAGGHPPALVVTPRGEVVQVAASGGVVGWPGAGSDNVAETVLHPGDALVLYTDGLVEARKNILDGMDALVRHAAEVAELPAGELARELVARALAGADRRDGTLALVLRRDPLRMADERARGSAPPTRRRRAPPARRSRPGCSSRAWTVTTRLWPPPSCCPTPCASRGAASGCTSNSPTLRSCSTSRMTAPLPSLWPLGRRRCPTTAPSAAAASSSCTR